LVLSAKETIYPVAHGVAHLHGYFVGHAMLRVALNQVLVFVVPVTIGATFQGVSFPAGGHMQRTNLGALIHIDDPGNPMLTCDLTFPSALVPGA
jgi:hypothetical protein